jgi:SAM-dependent methyltransferase
MSGFSAEWLALREPYDMRARNAAVLDGIADAFHDKLSISVVDLACGTGATLRALSPRLPSRQDWRLVDNDLSLLAQAAALARLPARTVAARAIDLARDLELALDGPVDLVTTSALLDLVSEEWLDRLAVETAARRLPVYAALSYQGRATLDPAEPFDLEMVAAINRHQRRNKGFGPALGPEAALRAVRAFERVGYKILPGASDWQFGPQDRAIQLAVLAGWAEAATELGDLPPAAVTAWLDRRRALLADGRAGMRIGHVDFFATPTATR